MKIDCEGCTVRIYPKVLAIAFALSTLVGVLYNIPFYVELIYPEPQAMVILGLIASVLSFVVNPLLMFVTFYFIGKRIETNNDFYSYLLSFFLGNLIGLTFGAFFISILQMQIIPFPYFLIHTVLESLLIMLSPSVSLLVSVH